MSDETKAADRSVRELLGFDLLDVQPTPETRAVDDGQPALRFIVPPLRGLYQPFYIPVEIFIPNTQAALAVAVRSTVRALSMLNN